MLDDYELSFESGERMRGRFLVTRLDYAGDYNGERNYTLSLESSGAVVSAVSAGANPARGEAALRVGGETLRAAAELRGAGRGRGGTGAAVRAGRAGGGGAG